MQGIKDGIAIARDGLALLIFITLILWPSWVGKRLEKAGFVKGSIAGWDWQAKKDEIKESSQQMLKMGDQLFRSQHNLDSLSAIITTNDSFKNNLSLRKLSEQIKLSSDSIHAIDTRLKSNFLGQQKLIESIPQDLLEKDEAKKANVGWIYLGKVNQNKTWEVGNPTTIESVEPSKLQGQAVTVKTSVYLRTGYKTSEKAVDVITENEKAKIIETKFNPRKNGFHVWAKVQIDN